MRFFATSRETAAATPEKLRSTLQEEMAVGQRLYAEGIILQAYVDPGFRRTFMIVEAPSLAAVRALFAAYPQVRQGLIEFEFTPLVGLPAIAASHHEHGTDLPRWWPPKDP